METTTVHVSKNNFATIQCPFCGHRQRVTTEHFKEKTHTIKVRCKCKSRFQILFNFRNNYRKSVSIIGEFRMLTPRVSIDRKMETSDLSRNGLRFKMIDPVVVNVGDELLVKFILDDRKQAHIRKKVIVRHVDTNFLGCEFLELTFYEKELGFYLLT